MEKGHNLKISNFSEDNTLLDYPINKRNLSDTTTIKEIRIYLEADKNISDFVFLDAEGFQVAENDEHKTLTKDLGELKIVSKKKKSKPAEKIVSTYERPDPKKDYANTNFTHTNIGELEKLRKNDQSTTGQNYSTIKELDAEHFNKLLGGLNHLHGFKFNKGGIIVLSEDLPFDSVDIPTNFQNRVVKDESTVRQEKLEKSNSKLTLMKFGYSNVDVSLASPFVGVSGFYSQENAENEEKSSSSSYYFQTTDVRKGQLNLNNYRVIKKEFTEYFNNNDITEKTVNDFIDKYGAYVLDLVIVGGRLYTVETASANNQFNQKDNKHQFGAGGNKTFLDGTVDVKAGADHGTGEKKTNENSYSKQNLKIENKGGDSLKALNESEWKNSLTDYKTWDIIEILRMTKTFDLLPKDVFEKIQNKFSGIVKTHLKLENFMPEGNDSEWVTIRNKGGQHFLKVNDQL